MTLRAGAALLCLVGAAHPAAAMPSAEGRQLAGSCAACHQPGAPQPGAPQPGAPQPGAPQPGAPQPGAPQPGAHDAIPPIMGSDEGRTVSLMLAYRSGARQSQVMHVVASALSAEEITAVAHYLAGQSGEQP